MGVWTATGRRPTRSTVFHFVGKGYKERENLDIDVPSASWKPILNS